MLIQCENRIRRICHQKKITNRTRNVSHFLIQYESCLYCCLLFERVINLQHKCYRFSTLKNKSTIRDRISLYIAFTTKEISISDCIYFFRINSCWLEKINLSAIRAQKTRKSRRKEIRRPGSKEYLYGTSKKDR